MIFTTNCIMTVKTQLAPSGVYPKHQQGKQFATRKFASFIQFMYDEKKNNLDFFSNNHDPVPRRLTGTQTSPSLLLYALYITFMQHL